ncbi:MAG: hypothetical protein R6V62_03080 [Candidatus Fermentibacteraceae bacterium]
MIRIRRQGLTSKLFSLIGGVATGLVITMAVVIPMPGKQIPVLTTNVEPVPAPKAIQVKELSDLTPTVEQYNTQPLVPRQQEQPVQITPAPVLTLQLETSLPDQTGRNLALQQQTNPVEPSRVTHQLSQAWEPGIVYTPRYLPHTASGNHPRRPDFGQPGITGRDGRNPKPPEGPEPASYGN